MDKPIILTVDDEPAVLSAIARDLRHEYGGTYRIVRAESGASALETVEQVKLRGEQIALMVADQRMPQMTGVEFLHQAVELYPDVKRVLLTAYADTDAAIRAINDVRLDYYLMKPWDPPEDNLYPVLTDLLDDWQASFPPPFEGIRVIGHRWSSPSHAVKDFLVRNLVPYRWLDIETDEEARQLLELTGGDGKLPVVLFPDGTQLIQPTNAEIAEKIGLRTHAGLPFYDLVVVGGGPAGLAASVYGASEGLKTLLVEREALGGQAGTSSRIENYLGFPSGLSGHDLVRRAEAQASRFGTEILRPLEAAGVRIQDPYRVVTLSDGSEVSCHALLITSGVSYYTLDVPGVERLTGAGVYYGAVATEPRSLMDQDAFIVGGGNSAGQAAMYLARFARSITILIRGTALAASMSRYLIDRIDETPNVTVRPHSQVVEAMGEDHLECLRIADSQDGSEWTAPAAALFIFIGARPRTDWVADAVARDAQGYILSGADILHDGASPRIWPLQREPFWLETSVPGIFVAGDVRHRSVKRVASAVGEGSMAVQLIHQYLASL